jgi:hypothetical protein
MLEACQEKMENIPEEVKPKAEDQKVPNEEAAKATIGTQEDQHGDRQLDKESC